MSSPLERVLLRDRVVISVVLAALTILSWAQMARPDDALMPCCATFGATFSMWAVMMAGMMIPSVVPMVLTHAAIVRRRAARGGPFVPSGLFLSGYLLAWTLFSLAAAIAQGVLYRVGLLGRSLAVGPWAGAAVLVLAAIFQLSPVKEACLARCRAPVGWFITEWREGRLGALRMGLAHGLFCIGCCWLLMAILFAVGIMNLAWSAAITAFVIAEKILPWRRAVVWSGTAVCLAGAAALVVRVLAT